MTEPDIAKRLRESGPLSGAELQEAVKLDVFSLWRTCMQAADLRFERIGWRYLRLDRAVEGFARLSPSIRREFLTYTVLAHRDDGDALRRKAEQLTLEIREISRRKIGLAREVIASVVEGLSVRKLILQKVCFIIAGDVTYDMAHAVPRPESSTGQMVRGSDLDVVAVTVDDVPPDAVQALDDAMYKTKHYLLVHPDYREELDYLIKDLAKVRAQMAFDTFESMVACKIMDEGQLLYGSPAVFRSVKSLLEKHGIPGQLAAQEKQAAGDRAEAEKTLMKLTADARESEFANLFYTTEEKEEIY